MLQGVKANFQLFIFYYRIHLSKRVLLKTHDWCFTALNNENNFEADKKLNLMSGFFNW